MSSDLFEILSKYETKRMSNPYPYKAAKMDFEYNFQDGDRSMHLVIGEDNFTYDSRKSKFYEIVNGDKLNRELKCFFMQLSGYRRHRTAYLYEGIVDNTFKGVDVDNYKDKGQITWYGKTRTEPLGKVYFDGTIVLDYLDDLPIDSNELNFSVEIGKPESVPLRINEKGNERSVGSINFDSNYDYALIMLSGSQGSNSNNGITIVNDLYEIDDVRTLIEEVGLN